MKKMNSQEMSQTYAAGCGWLKRLAKGAEADGRSGDAQAWAIQWADCRMA